MKIKSAYTLIELLVSVTIVALLVVLVVVNYSGIVAKSRDQRRWNDLKSVQLSIETYKFENKQCPPGGYKISSDLLESKRDPRTGSRYFYKPDIACKYEICALMETKRNLEEDFVYTQGGGSEVYNFCLYGDRILRELIISN